MRILQCVVVALGVCISPAVILAETLPLTDIVQQAGARAAERIETSRRAGYVVNSAMEFVVEQDQLCLASFHEVDAEKMTLSSTWCVAFEGAYERRQQGFSEARLRSVQQYVMSYSSRGPWESLERDIFKREDIFAELQHLLRTSEVVRNRLIRIVVGHTTTFVDPATGQLFFRE